MTGHFILSRRLLWIESILLILTIMISLIPFALMRSMASFLNPFQGIASSLRMQLLNHITIKSNKVRGSAIIIFDNYGIPHIFATTRDAAFYSLGWLEASQRLFQMDIIRRFMEGNLSALLGKRALSEDIFINSLWLPEVIDNTTRYIKSNKAFLNLSRYVNDFINGINDYIAFAERNNLLPPEYKILGQKPEPWKFKDVVAIEKFLSFMLSYSDSDLILQRLVSRWGPRILLFMDIINRSENIAVAPCSASKPWGSAIKGLKINLKSGFLLSSFSESLKGAPNPTPIIETIDQVKGFLNMFGSDILEMSNDWVISGNFTYSGKPIVANDPHLTLTAPSLWMPVHIKAPDLDVAGVILPGSPFVVIGRNRHIAWGFTNLLGDFVDYYYYVWNGTSYYYLGRWLKPISKNITIKIWNPIRRVYTYKKITIRRTINGPLLDINGSRYAVAWTGLYPSNELEFIMELNFASSVKEALYAQRYFGSPIQNFIVADDKGNFAWSPVGYYPVRTNLPTIDVNGIKIVNEGFLPFNGSKGEGLWKGFVNLSKLPVLYDPILPFIATANTKPWRGSCGFYIGYQYADRFRLERIRDLLYQLISRPERITASDVIKVQLDIVDLSVKDYLNLLIQLLERGGERFLSPRDLEIINKLMAWNGTMYKNLWQPTVALAWALEFHKDLWQYLYGSSSDLFAFRIEYAESLIKNYLIGRPGIYKILERGFLERLSAQSFKEAKKILEGFYKTDDYEKWTYGKIHYYDPVHPLGSLFPRFNYPKEEAPGGPYTINVAMPSNFSSKTGMPVTLAPSVRLVSDLGTQIIYVSLPGGVSGNPFSRYYYNLYLMWVRGEYVTINLNSTPKSLKAIASFKVCGEKG